MSRSTNVALRGILLIGLAIVVGSCGAGTPRDAVFEKRDTSAVSVPWLYYPLDALNHWWAGYHAYGFNCPGLNCVPCHIHNAYDLAGPLNAVVRAAGHGTVIHVVNSCGSSDGSDGSGCAPGSCTAGQGCGNSVTIAHDGPGTGEFTKYCHLNGVTTSVGKVVDIGTPIGSLGQTEAVCNSQNGVQHLHFTVSTTDGGGWGCTVGDTHANCIDPGSPPGEHALDSGCAGTTTPNVQWVTTSAGSVEFARSMLVPVNVQVVAGSGTIKVTRDNQLQGNTNNKVFYFNIGDPYTFEALPAAGNTFAKFCGDTACTITTDLNPFSGKIDAPSGSVFAYFNTCVPEPESRTCSLMSQFAGVQVCGSGWTNNCGQDVTCHCSASTTQTCDNTPGSPTEGTCVSRSGVLYGFYDCFAGCVPNCAGKNCGDDSCGGYCGSGTGGCAAGYVCSGGNCIVPPPTCPTGSCNTSNATGWCGAGYYCNSSGVANGTANTLYYCSAAGGPATSPRHCSEECHFRPGLNDACWEDTSSCSYWRPYNVDACGWDYVNGNPRIDYHCYYGAKSIYQWCAPGRCAWGSVNDYCY